MLFKSYRMDKNLRPAAAYEPVQKHKVTAGIPGWLNKRIWCSLCVLTLLWKLLLIVLLWSWCQRSGSLRCCRGDLCIPSDHTIYRGLSSVWVLLCDTRIPSIHIHFEIRVLFVLLSMGLAALSFVEHRPSMRLSCGSTPDRPHYLTSIFTHSDHIVDTVKQSIEQTIETGQISIIFDNFDYYFL